MVERRRRLPDVLEAREALETKLAELAAERRTEDELAAMRSALGVLTEEIAGSRTESLREPGRPSRSLSRYRTVLDAIAAGQPRQAAAELDPGAGGQPVEAT
ncbi:FCD domain-containing protein [Streptomyces massasporeus]|uniref:FCD domain-containing protein n=1 Tax=Streptomyces massasporeus TaxID=67324 RepID=UPI003F4D3537